MIKCLYIPIDERISYLKKRPRMYIAEVRIDYIYYFLTGYLTGNLSSPEVQEIDFAFHRDFNNWVEDWVYENKGMDMRRQDVPWYLIISRCTDNEEEAVELFYKLSDEIFQTLRNKQNYETEKIECPCCNNFTQLLKCEHELLFETCEVCFWQYHQVAHLNPDIAFGQNLISLKDARESYKQHGACQKKFKHLVREPLIDELPESNKKDDATTSRKKYMNNLRYVPIDEMISDIKKRPGMYVNEVRLDYIYHFLVGFLGGNVSIPEAQEIDIAFRRNFIPWVDDWIYKEKGIEFIRSQAPLWYQRISLCTNNEEEAVELFYKLSEEFFQDLRNSHKFEEPRL